MYATALKGDGYKNVIYYWIGFTSCYIFGQFSIFYLVTVIYINQQPHAGGQLQYNTTTTTTRSESKSIIHHSVIKQQQ